jgi:hypothetical protein
VKCRIRGDIPVQFRCRDFPCSCCCCWSPPLSNQTRTLFFLTTISPGQLEKRLSTMRQIIKIVRPFLLSGAQPLRVVLHPPVSLLFNSRALESIRLIPFLTKVDHMSRLDSTGLDDDWMVSTNGVYTVCVTAYHSGSTDGERRSPSLFLWKKKKFVLFSIRCPAEKEKKELFIRYRVYKIYKGYIAR